MTAEEATLEKTKDMSTPITSRSPQQTATATSPVKNEDMHSPESGASDGEQSDAPSESAPSSSAKGKGKAGDSDAPSAPLQKRRRVTRACDECRRKKIKCDGKQPCTHCQVYSYDCTYDKPSNRRRNPAPQYIEALEQKLSRAENLLRKFMPDVDLNDPALDPSVQQEFRLREQARAQALQKDNSSTTSGSSSTKDAKLMSMITSVGQLDLNEKGDYNFHGLSSGAVFFRRMKDHFRGILGRDYKIPTLPRGPTRPLGVISLDSPRSPASSPGGKGVPDNLYNLPPKAIADTLCEFSLSYATCLLRVVHIPSFRHMVNDLYERAPDNLDENDNRSLALLYSVLALGCMYNVHDNGAPGQAPYEIAMEEGLKYYTSARMLLQDVTECRDLTSLQALLFMILFIQSISNLSTCYGFVGIALRSSLRMGLHRNISLTQGDAIESETRRRVFYVCRQLDTYISALLGFPLLLNDEDVDQPLPTPVDDEFISIQGILPVPSGTPSFFEAFNAHAQLMDLMSKIIKNIYPLKGIEQSAEKGRQATGAYMISYTKVKELEENLAQWYEQLPLNWRPNPDGPEEVVRVRNLLRFAYAHVQMVLYRPFIHYVSPRVSAGKHDDRAYACAAAGINVARNIVHIGIEMRKQVSLVGPYWFTFFTEFFAIISLVFFVLENQDKPGTMDILADAVAGKEMIVGLARRSMAADRISNALQVLFDQLPDNLKKVKGTKVSTKKRSSTGSRIPSMAMPSPSALHAKLRNRRPEQSSRSRSSSARPRTGSIGSANPSLDTMNFSDPDFGIGNFSPNLQGVSPLDIAASTPESVHSGSLPDHSQSLHGPAGLNPLHKLDAMMFPSTDPLAYPNPPRVKFGPQPHAVATAGIVDTQPQQDGSQFYVPNIYDDIEGHLMGPLPPYLMQNPGQPGFDFPAQMYSDPMLSLGMARQSHYRQHQPHPLAHAQQHPQQTQQELLQRQHDRINQYTNTPWNGLFPHYE